MRYIFNSIINITLVLFVMLSTSIVHAQSSIPKEYRGTEEAIARGILDGNQIETNFRNHGEMSRWNDIPWGVWPKNNGGKHIDGIGFIMAGRVMGHNNFNGVIRDTLLNPVIINFREFGRRTSPYSGAVWGWLPLNGFNNPNRTNGLGESEPIPAISTDETSWPQLWPDRLNETIDAGWENSWNGFRGKGLVTGDQESFYVIDDLSDKEYGFGEESEGQHSSFGVYYPSPSDSSIGGLGLQTEVRTFQFNDVIAKDMLFTQYRTTNVSEKDIPETWTLLHIDIGLGSEEYDDNAKLIAEDNLVVFWDADGIGEPTNAGQSNYNLGYVGFLLLEHSISEEDGMDDDKDGIIDESKFNGPGEFIEGKAAIDAYLESNYNMEVFAKNYLALENFPAYKHERWWTGDEDLDWVPHEDFNLNGIQDDGEELIDDLGRDGLGPNSPNYPGPDKGEGDGIPTQGEPNFGEQDMLEAENKNLGMLDLFTPGSLFPEGIGGALRDDTWLFGRIEDHQFSNPDYEFVNGVTNDEPMVLFGTENFELKAGTSSYFITALIFGEDEEDLMKKVEQAKLIHESDYGQSELRTLPVSNEEIAEAPIEFSLSQNFPNPFNPTTNIEFSLSKSSSVSLKVYDITGREVRVLVSNRTYTTGKHSVQLNASELSSGVYIYRLEVAGEVFTRKLTLIK